MSFKAVFKLIKDTIAEWNEDKVPLWAAGLSYYTIFSLAPLLIIAIAIAGAVFGEDAARGEIVGQIQGLVGRQGAEAIEAMIQNAAKPSSGGNIATIIGIVTLLFGASGVFSQLQDALNSIWDVKPDKSQGVKKIVWSRFLSFAMVLVIGFLLLVSLVLSAGLQAVGTWFGNLLPGVPALWQALNFGVSFGVITLLFAMIYKFLPDVKVPWSDLWVGAGVTAFLFTIGKWLIGLYLGNSSVGSTYGAAGSLVVVLLWIYYSAQILLFGAEFTQVYAKTHGSRFVRKENPIAVGVGGESGSGQASSSNDRDSTSPDRGLTRSSMNGSHSQEFTQQRAHPPYGRYVATALGAIVALAGLRRNGSRRSDRSRRRRR